MFSQAELYHRDTGSEQKPCDHGCREPTTVDHQAPPLEVNEDLKFHDHLSEDGVHPLSSGHAMIAERVLQVLSRLG